MRPLEMWGGLECTLNRVNDRYVDQCEKNGHYKRFSDIKLFHDLGIKKIRYPCLWEIVAPKSLDHCHWSFLDERLGELRRLEQEFIAGFLHHGSGPLYTSLIDPDFPTKFSTYARMFAQRYPWVNDYTPINEINTTARFSALYGHWYPHLKNELMFYRAVLLQCKATVLAMREIRAINPSARLIQTDDLGKCQGTDFLRYQVEFENERRWLAWDLLSGRVGGDHPLYERMLHQGIDPREISWFEENPCTPDVIGINHYHLSNRYLDHRLDMFPEWFHGGNDIHSYVDVGAIDTGLVEPVDVEILIREAWERYGSTIAITECHIKGRRESQMRWLHHVWNTCKKLQIAGVDIEAVCAWSLLGTYDWHNLCTNCEGHYESGVFDLRNPGHVPQETGLSKMVMGLAREGKYESPLLLSEGTWKTPRRILFHPLPGTFTSLEHPFGSRPVVITGGNGTLGKAFARVCGERNIHFVLTTRNDLDITDVSTIRSTVEKYNPWAIINAAGYVKVDEAEENVEECFRENVEGAVNLARVCKEKQIPLLTFSTDLVFSGENERIFAESSALGPLNTYGKSKAMSEEKVLEILPESLIIRTSSFFGPWDEYNFITKTLLSLAQKTEVTAPKDMFISPTYVPDLANESLDLLIDGERGIVHLTNVGEVSWEQFARLAIEAANERFHLDSTLLKGISSDEVSAKARRPKRSVLRSEKHLRLPPLENAVKRYMNELQISIEQENR